MREVSEIIALILLCIFISRCSLIFKAVDKTLNNYIKEEVQCEAKIEESELTTKTK
jgi:hypothetical protein